jgi:hypothetical protein
MGFNGGWHPMVHYRPQMDRVLNKKRNKNIPGKGVK